MLLLLIDLNKNAEIELTERIRNLLKGKFPCAEGMDLKSLLFNYYPEIVGFMGGLFGTLNYFELGMIFSIRYGLPEYRVPDFNKNHPGDTVQKEKLMLRFVRASHLEQSQKHTLVLNQLAESETTDGLYFPDMHSSKWQAVMDEKYLLNKNDILVTHKGMPRIVSVDMSHPDPHTKYIASQQFFVLKLKEDFLHLNAVDRDFLMVIVRYLLEKELTTRYESKVLENEDKIKAEKNNLDKRDTKYRRSISSIMSSLTKEAISKIKITIPKDDVNQRKVLALLNAMDEVKKETTKMETELKKLILE